MQNTTETQLILDSLEHILQTSQFTASPKMSAFLRYIVTQTLKGKSERIKAYTIAIEALGKPVTFDPQSDASVRLIAYRLRKALLCYYQTASEPSVKIELPIGRYVPILKIVELHAD